MMISPTLDVDWELRETGPVEARHSVLLLPGGACSAAFYNELTVEPALAGLRLAAATLPGHAGTPAPSDLSTQNYGRLAAQLAAVKHCDTVLGFSMGSTVALEMATTAGFTGPLILTGASFSRKAESTMLEVLDALARVTGALPYAFMRSMFGPMLKQSTIPAERQAELLAEFKRNQPKELRRLMRAYLRDLGREPLIGDRLRALEAPVWIVHADKGDGRLTTQERRSLEECPNVSVVTIPGRSFFLPNEHPAQLAALIVEALAAVSATPATTATPTPPPRQSTG
jgi:pimeloyl-ACP methyl ester carboxylesterase